MPWFSTKDGKRTYFRQMPENMIIAGIPFCAGDYACVEDDNKLKCITEADFLAMTKDMKKCDWD